MTFQAVTDAWPLYSILILIFSLALSAIVLYRRYVSRRALVQRVGELSALSRAGGALVSSTLDIAALCNLIYQEASSLIDTRTFQVGLFDGDRYVIQVWVVDGRQQQRVSFDLSENRGLIGWIRDNRRSLLVNDFEKELHKLPAQPRYISQDPPRSALFIPLVGGEQVLGILAAQSDEPGRFSDRDLRLLTIIGNQAGAAIANALLFQQEQKRAAQMALVNQTANQINASAELGDIFDQVVHLTSDRFQFNLVNIFCVDGPDQRLQLRASSSKELAAPGVFVPPGEGLVGNAFDAKTSIVANNVFNDPRYLPSLDFSNVNHIGLDTKSEIAIPLIVDEEPLGVLDVHSTRFNAFEPPERTALEALAAQVAIAIFHARQLDIQREQAWLSTAQLQIAEAIGRSDGMEQLLEGVSRLATLLIGLKGCAILIWDQDSESYVPGAISTRSVEEERAFQSVRLNIGEWTALDAVHVGQEMLVTERQPPWTTDWHRCALYPLIAKGEMVAVLVAFPPASSDVQHELLRSTSSQAAQAISSAQLDLAQQEEAWVNTALLQVAEAVNSLTNVRDILSTIVRFVPLLVGVEFCVALIYDEAERTFAAGPSHGLSDMGRGLLESFTIPESELPVLATHDQDVTRSAPAYYRLSLPPWMQTSFKTDSASAFLLNARNRLVGALMVGPSVNGRLLAGRRMSILTGIAHQASIALVNDHLYQEAAERQKLAQELQVAQQIQASLIPMGKPAILGGDVDSTWLAAREVSGDFYDFLHLGDSRWGIVVADVADKGMPAALFMAVTRTILRAVAFNRMEPAITLERVNELICNDSQSDLFVTVFYAIWNGSTNRLAYASAGHNPALLVRRDGRQLLLNTEGMALGVLNRIRVEQREVELQAEDILVFYTDGVTEAINEDFDEFDLSRLRATVATNRRKSAEEISQAIVKAVHDHAGDAAQFDDITLVVFKRTSGLVQD